MYSIAQTIQEWLGPNAVKGQKTRNRAGLLEFRNDMRQIVAPSAHALLDACQE